MCLIEINHSLRYIHASSHPKQAVKVEAATCKALLWTRKRKDSFTLGYSRNVAAILSQSSVNVIGSGLFFRKHGAM
jgi:hypothetical protein